jgi:hypothetical protein
MHRKNISIIPKSYRFNALSLAAYGSDPALRDVFRRGPGGRSVRKAIPMRLKLKANDEGAQVKIQIRHFNFVLSFHCCFLNVSLQKSSF